MYMYNNTRTVPFTDAYVYSLQAVMASDFAMGRFYFLEKLLLVHGHWSYSRLARIMLYFFYKNIVSELLSKCNIWSLICAL